jgi:hypothetical protein
MEVQSRIDAGPIQALQDRLDLIELAARAARTFDENDAHGYADCFLEDGLYESPRIGLRAKGRIELMEMCSSRGGEDLHFCMNFEIELHGNEARVRSALLLSSRNGPLVNTTGHYISDCVRTPQGWRYRHKVSYLDRRG